MPPLKTCKLCGESKPITDYHRSKSRRDGLSPLCGKCNTAKMRKWRLANPDRYRANGVRRRLRLRYGITPEDVAAIRRAQNERCALCLKPLDTVTPHVDHDHETGRVRGVLCAGCNGSLGFVVMPGWLTRALGYVYGGESDPTVLRFVPMQPKLEL